MTPRALGGFAPFLLALALLTGTAGPLRAVDLDNVLTGYSVSTWTHADGLRLGSVYAMVQDLDGYLWIGTDAGLIRFDGVRFVPWDRLSNTRLPGLEVSALALSKDGSLLVGFGDGAGICRLRGEQVEPGSEPRGQLVSVTAIVEDPRGKLWAVIDRALFRFAGSHWEEVPVQLEGIDQFVNSAHVDPQGRLLVGTVVGLFELTDETQRFQRISNRWVWGVSEDAGGTLWITDIDAGFKKLHEPLPRRAVRANGYRLVHDEQGSLWVGTLGAGLWRVRDGGAIEKLTLHSGLSSDSIQSLLQDREGNIWVGTTGGLHRLTPRKLNPIVDISPVVAVEASDRSTVWIGTSNGLVAYRIGDGQLRGQRVGPSDLFVRNLRFDRSGTLWIAARYGGLYRLSGGTPTAVTLPREYSLSPVTSMAADPRSGIWLCDSTRAVRWDGLRLTPLQIPPESEPAKITWVMGDSTGRVWFAVEGGRLGVRNPDGGIRTFSRHDGYRAELHDRIFDIFEDTSGSIWISSSGALTRFSDGRFVTLTHENGLPRNRMGAIADDGEGGVWLNVEVGLVRLTRNDFEKAAANPSQRLQFQVYDTSDGLAGVPILNVRAARSADGRLWFIRGGGLTVVEPRDIVNRESERSWTVRIEGAVADERRFAAGAPVSLPAGTKNLQISYTAMTLTAPDKIPFRYRLEGFDTDWIDAGTRRQAYYTNLPPRTYRFRVETKSDRSPNASSVSWDLIVAPMFYQTNWFYGLSLAVFGLAVGGAWRLRLGLVRRRFAAVLEERTRLSREIHDTLLQSLVGVALQFDDLSQSLPPLASGVEEPVRAHAPGRQRLYP